MKTAIYDTDLTDSQWEYLQPMLPTASQRGRPPTDRRVVLNAILYVLKGGIAWRLLPSDFPPWQTVYGYYWQWRNNGLWEQINTWTFDNFNDLVCIANKVAP